MENRFRNIFYEGNRQLVTIEPGRLNRLVKHSNNDEFNDPSDNNNVDHHKPVKHKYSSVIALTELKPKRIRVNGRYMEVTMLVLDVNR